jgi:hypothetical protein
MDDNQNRRHQMFVRVREFIQQRIEDFSETGVVRQLFTELKVTITGIEQLASAQVTGIGQARQGTESRGETRAKLRDDIDAIYGVARTMGVESQFQRPTANNDEALLHAARSFATNALPLKAQFIAHEMPEDFLDELNADINALAAAIVDQGNAVGDHVAASAEIDEVIDRGLEIVRKLDPIMKNKYASSASARAEWTSASHTERAPKRAPAPKGPTSTPPTSTPPEHP